MSIRILSFLMAFAFFSCSGSFDKTEYVKWVENEQNGLRIKRSSPSVEYVLQYEPSFYKALRFSPSGNKKDLTEAKEQFGDMHHFMLKIRPKKTFFTESEAELSSFMAYDLRKNIRFAEGKDTLDRTVMYHLESSGGVSPYQRILLAFPKAQKLKSLNISIKPNKMDSIKQEFNFDARTLKKLQSVTERIK